MIIQLHAEIKLVQLYTCSVCGAQASGSTRRVTYDGDSAYDLKDFVESQQPRSHEMPVGWSYNGEFTCGKRCAIKSALTAS